MAMTFEGFLELVYLIDPFAEVYERDGTLSIDTNWIDVGDPEVPMGYAGTK